VHVALNLMPFCGVAFRWFMGVVRTQIGDGEDKFFTTVYDQHDQPRERDLRRGAVSLHHRHLRLLPLS
jgi:hypothetical protein